MFNNWCVQHQDITIKQNLKAKLNHEYHLTLIKRYVMQDHIELTAVAEEQP